MQLAVMTIHHSELLRLSTQSHGRQPATVNGCGVMLNHCQPLTMLNSMVVGQAVAGFRCADADVDAWVAPWRQPCGSP